MFIVEIGDRTQGFAVVGREGKGGDWSVKADA
jgi:hypothetical protein